MTIRPIVIHGDPVLHHPTEPVTEPIDSPELQELIADMYETLDLAHGVGLAANQVGVNKRLFVYHCPDTDGPDGTEKTNGAMRKGTVINPVLETSEIPETMPLDDGSDDEGCLSVPGEGFPTGRADWARVTGKDEHGEDITVEGYGFFARMLQHETGHLDGIVYTDTLIGRFKRQAKKAIKRHGWNQPGLTWLPGEDPDPFGHDEYPFAAEHQLAKKEIRTSETAGEGQVETHEPNISLGRGQRRRTRRGTPRDRGQV